MQHSSVRLFALAIGATLAGCGGEEDEFEEDILSAEYAATVVTAGLPDPNPRPGDTRGCYVADITKKTSSSTSSPACEIKFSATISTQKSNCVPPAANPYPNTNPITQFFLDRGISTSTSGSSVIRQTNPNASPPVKDATLFCKTCPSTVKVDLAAGNESFDLPLPK